MNTRVSWIDPIHIQSLLARLGPQDAESLPESESCDIDTLSDHTDFMGEAVPLPAPVEHFLEDLSTPKAPAAPPAVEEPPAPMPTVQAPEPIPEPVREPVPESDDGMLPLDRIRERLRIIRHRAAEAGMLSTPTIAPVTDSAPNFETSLAAFASAESQQLPPGFTLIICDDQGGVLWSNDSKPGLTLSTLMAHRSARHSSSEVILSASQVIHHALPADQILSVFSCPSRSGDLQIAIKGSTAADQQLIDSWRTSIAKL